jgi:hypothetical protein
MNITKDIQPQDNLLPDHADFMQGLQYLVDQDLIDPEMDDPNEGETSKDDELDFDGACDPFSYLTAPGMCAAIFKGKFLKKNSIAQINPAGYENNVHSLKSCEYFEYLNRFEGFNIVHALNSPDGREVKLLNKFRVDGFDRAINTVFEFNGCFFHGCPKCIQNRNELNPVLKLTYDFLHERTLAKQSELSEAGFKVEVMWECEWEKKKRTEPEIKKKVENIHVKTRLNPRDAFRGGRVEAGKIYYNIEQSQHKLGVHYKDICSLYPYVNSTEFYPVGHPKIILKDFDGNIDNYFGLIQCSILPPQNLRQAVLPVHLNNKLLFPLCRTCATINQIDVCMHSEDERVLHGVWFSEELKVAIRDGYQLKTISAVHHFERKSNQLFAEYIKTFFKIKLAASGRPPNETDEDLEHFIAETERKEGICMCPEDFKINSGLRNVGKLCCNCMWGRLGMRDAFSSVSLCYDLEALNSIIHNDHYQISTARRLSDKCMAVLHSNKSPDTLNFTNNTNIYLAVITTAYARLKLLNLMKHVGGRFLYCDTDSIFYEISPNAEENLPTGEFMGELTNELKEGEVIIEFVSGGPKIYGYKTSFGNVVVKVKGFQLNIRNAAAFSFENLKRIVLHNFHKHLDSSIGRVRQEKDRNVSEIRKKIFRDYHGLNPDVSSAVATEEAISTFNVARIHRDLNWKLLSQSEQKVYTFRFGKSIIRDDFSCVPFGFVEC